MRISIESFYVNGSSNINNLWYEDGFFSVQKESGRFFQISRDNTAKNLREISPEQVKKADKIGYFTIFEGLGSPENYSINYTCRLLGEGNGPSHESNNSNDSSNNNNTSNDNSTPSSNDYVCGHNNRAGVSAADVTEHLLNADLGGALRDAIDLMTGHESLGGLNQAPNSASESISSNTSKAG